MKSLTIDFLNNLNLTAEQGSTLSKIGEYKGKQELFTRYPLGNPRFSVHSPFH